jgi:hypothetical protein
VADGQEIIIRDSVTNEEGVFNLSDQLMGS